MKKSNIQKENKEIGILYEFFNKDTNAHEIFHSIVDGLGGFNRFWGEGITEFCKKAMYNRTEYSYPKNVEMVFLAYSMFGNIILKDYFSKQGDKFYFHLAKGAENHLFQIMMKIGENLDINKYMSNTDLLGKI